VGSWVSGSLFSYPDCASVPVFFNLPRLNVELPFALNPHIIGYSSAVMAEAPYILMMLATVLMVDMYANHQKIRGKGIMGTFFGPGITYLVKTIGLAFLPATPLYLIHKKHARKAILAFIAFMIIAGLWAYRNFTKTESLVSSRYEKVMEVHYGDQDTLLSTLKGFFVGAINNTWELLTKFMPATMIGFWIEYRFPNSIIILRVISLIITTIILFGFIHQVQKGIGFAEFLIFFATGIALLWPFMYERRVIPYLPFLYVYLVSGIDCVLQVLTKRIDVLTKHKRIVLLILSSALLINAGRGIQGVLRPVRNRLEDISYSANWVQWLNAELPKEAVIMTPYGPSIYLYLNRETLPYPEICDTEFIIEHTKQANFILIQPLLNAPKKFSEYTDNCLRPTIKRAEDIYKLIYEVPDEFIEVYRIEKP
jgi:hypothetical protein